MKITENFESMPLSYIQFDQQYKTPSGLILELWKMSINDRPRDIWEPSAIAASYAKNWNDPNVTKIFGEKELRIGDRTQLKITFPGVVKNLRFQYYQAPDYTKADEAFSGKALKDLKPDDLHFFFRAFHNADEKMPMQVAPAFTEVRWGEYAASPFTSVVFENALIGSLHIDQISWDN